MNKYLAVALIRSTAWAWPRPVPHKRGPMGTRLDLLPLTSEGIAEMLKHQTQAIQSLLHRRGQMSTTAIVFLVLGIVFFVMVVVGAVLLALLLPAVQQARAAARRTQSRNNLKQIALALHNYESVYHGLPLGTYSNEKLKPEERLSWQAAILPFMDQSALHQSINSEEAWDDESNRNASETRIQVYLNPGYPVPVGVAETHYVGIAGLGKDAPMLPANSNRAGVFAFNRKTGFRDITDGLSNTMMTSEASGQFGSWIAGGNATIRSLTTKPYINGPDGIGGPYTGGCQIGLADGSVRFVSENIDPVVFERLATMADGQVIGEF